MAETKNAPGQEAAGQAVPQPDAVITPGVASQPPTEPAQPTLPQPAAPLAPQPATPPAAAPTPQAPPLQPASTATPTPQPSEPAPPTATTTSDGQSVTWSASEFIAHDKSAGWYLLLAVGTLVLAGLVFLTTKDKFSTGVVVIVGLALGIYSRRRPRQLQYGIGRLGLSIDGKRHSYDEFRSFSVVEEGAFAGIIFMPLRRFAVPITIYCAPGDEEQITDILSDRLPFEEHRPDLIDSFLKQIRF